MMPYSSFPPYAPVYLPPSPAETEYRDLRREGHFLGTGMLLLILLQQTAASAMLILLISPSCVSRFRFLYTVPLLIEGFFLDTSRYTSSAVGWYMSVLTALSTSSLCFVFLNSFIEPLISNQY